MIEGDISTITTYLFTTEQFIGVMLFAVGTLSLTFVTRYKEMSRNESERDKIINEAARAMSDERLEIRSELVETRREMDDKIEAIRLESKKKEEELSKRIDEHVQERIAAAKKMGFLEHKVEVLEELKQKTDEANMEIIRAKEAQIESLTNQVYAIKAIVEDRENTMIGSLKEYLDKLSEKLDSMIDFMKSINLTSGSVDLNDE